MSTPPKNYAAAVMHNKAYPCEIIEVPYTHPSKGEIVVRSRALAINPADTMQQKMGTDFVNFKFLTFPFWIGIDLAGEVVEVADDVTDVKVGDRVVGLCRGTFPKVDTPRAGAQNYVILNATACSKIPDWMSFADASVIPLGMCTAANGMYLEGTLQLDLPTSPPAKANGKTVIMLGGASSVGANAIQLLVAAGYEVITTCSTKNFDFVKSIGASVAIDYKEPDMGAQIIKACEGKLIAGALNAAWDDKAYTNMIPVLKKVNCAPPSETQPKGGKNFVSAFFVPPADQQDPEVPGSYIGKQGMVETELAAKIWKQFLPEALEKKEYKCMPPAKVVGHGIEHVQTALDAWGAGVSAEKIVVTF